MKSGLYALMDACSDYERAFMHACLDEAGKISLRDLADQHTMFHKYTGKVRCRRRFREPLSSRHL